MIAFPNQRRLINICHFVSISLCLSERACMCACVCLCLCVAVVDLCFEMS